VIPDRAIRFPVRTVLTVLGIVIAVWSLIQVVSITRNVLTWILVAAFFAIALSPLVDWFQRHGVRRRGYAVALTALGVAGVIALIGWLVIRPSSIRSTSSHGRCRVRRRPDEGQGVSALSRSTTSSTGSVRL
jgi:predicted PurR-regulated permease PerM